MAADLIATPFADQGDKSAPPLTSSDGFVNLTEGYTKYYEISLESGDPQAKGVERAIQNYLFNLLTSNTQVWQQLGLSPWFAAMPGGYAKNAMVMRVVAGVQTPYRSLVAANATDPASSPASWEYIRTFAEITQKIPMPSGGLAGAAELITGTTNLDNLATGTYEIQTDAIAGTSNAPISPLDSVARAGMIECKVWQGVPNLVAVQRYTDRLGVEYARGASNGTWTAWIPQIGFRTQGDTISYALDTGVANALNIATTLSPTLVSRVDGMVLKVKVKAANTGACTINDGLGIVPIVGPTSPLQGAEFTVNGEAWLQWNTSIGAAPGSYLLMASSGGGKPVGKAVNTLHALQFGQAPYAVAGNADLSGESEDTGNNPAPIANFRGSETVVKTGTGPDKRAYVVGPWTARLAMNTTGLNGVDVGSSVRACWYGIYLIYNPTTGATGVIAQSAGLITAGATAGTAPEVYSGANMPAGFTASTLITIARTDDTAPGNLLTPFNLKGRWMSVGTDAILTLNQPDADDSPFNIGTAVPASAKMFRGFVRTECLNPPAGQDFGSSTLSIYVKVINSRRVGEQSFDSGTLRQGTGNNVQYIMQTGFGATLRLKYSQAGNVITRLVATGYLV